MLPMPRGVFCLRSPAGSCSHQALTHHNFFACDSKNLLLVALLFCILASGCASQQRAHLRTLPPEELSLRAQTGNARAQAVWAAVILENPKAEKSDYAAAVGLARPLADDNSADGLYALGLAYLYGRGVDRNCQEAVALLTRAAAAGKCY